MRTKRSKVYKRAMALYTTAFKFREPYQVLVDGEFVKRATSQKIDLYARFETIFGGPAKIMITQCAIKHLYDQGKEAQGAIEYAKSFERRKCNHWQTKESDDECISGVMGDENRYKYCVATQSNKLRNQLRKVPGVPLLFEKRSIILLEPPSDASVAKRQEIEESKLHMSTDELNNLRPSTSKPAQRTGTAAGAPTTEADEAGSTPASGVDAKTSLPAATRATAPAQPATAEQMLNRSYNANKRKRGHKEPNPLSVKKKKPRMDQKGKQNGSGSGKSTKDGSAASPAKQQAKANDVKGKGRASDDTGNATAAAAAAGVKENNKENLNSSLNQASSDPTKGVPRPIGDGTSKKAMKRKARKAAAAASAGGVGGAGVGAGAESGAPTQKKEGPKPQKGVKAAKD